MTRYAVLSAPAYELFQDLLVTDRDLCASLLPAPPTWKPSAAQPAPPLDRIPVWLYAILT